MNLWGTITAVTEWLQIGKTYTGKKRQGLFFQGMQEDSIQCKSALRELANTNFFEYMIGNRGFF